MKTLFEKLLDLLNESPQFKWKYLMLKCPDFIVNVFLGKSEIKPKKTESFLDYSSPVFVETSEINVFQLQPEYK